MITYQKFRGYIFSQSRDPRKDVKEFSTPVHLAGCLSKVKLNLLHKNGTYSSYKCLEKSLPLAISKTRVANQKLCHKRKRQG